MKIFYPEQLMRAVIDLNKFPTSNACQLAKKWRVQRPLQGTSGKFQVTHKLPRLISCATSALNSHQARIKRKQRVNQSQSHHKNAEHPASGQFKRNFNPKCPHKYKDRCPKCGDSAHLEGFQCPDKKFQCISSHTFGHFTGLCSQKNQQKQAHYKSRKPKAHEFKAGVLYVQDNSISGQSEDSS